MSEQRFEFGRNWRSFLAALSEDRIDVAIESLAATLEIESLDGQRFLDLGCGSGLFSLAAHQLGAEVVSIDFDIESVACTQELRARYGADFPQWKISKGSVLDERMMQSLGSADVVYSWGVLHHTGQLNRAIELAAARTDRNGLFCLAVYNDQGRGSRRWLAIKRLYHRLPRWIRPIWVVIVAGFYECKFAVARTLKGRNPSPCADWCAKRRDRGMSVWHDWVDWVGGLPFEVATPEQVESIVCRQGFTLVKSNLVGKGWGCNEFVFRRTEY